MWITVGGWIAAGVLILAGIGKIRTPQPTAGALRRARLPDSPAAVRLLGGVEVGAGLAAVIVALPWSLAAVAALYCAFAGFAIMTLRRGGASACGCFGRAGTPLTGLHVTVDLLAAAVASAAAATGAGPVTALPGGTTVLEAGLVLAVTVVGAVSIRLLLTSGAEVLRLTRGRPA